MEYGKEHISGVYAHLRFPGVNAPPTEPPTVVATVHVGAKRVSAKHLLQKHCRETSVVHPDPTLSAQGGLKELCVFGRAASERTVWSKVMRGSTQHAAYLENANPVGSTE